MTGLVLVVVLITKFMHGAWIAIARDDRALPADEAASAGTTTGSPRELAADERRGRRCCRRGCTRSCWSRRSTSRRCGPSPTRAPCAPRPLEAVTVNVDPEETKALQAEWDRRGIPVPLKVLDSPYREITRPVLDYVRAVARRKPARPGRRLHPGVRRRPLVGAAAAQPERAAAQGPAALHAGCDGDQRAVAAAPAQQGSPRSAEGAAPGAVAPRASATVATSVEAAGCPERGRAWRDPRPERRGRRRAGRARRALRRPARGPGRLRPARPAGGAGARGRHRGHGDVVLLARGRRRGPAGERRPGRAALPLGAARAVRRLRLAARLARRAAPAEGRRGPRAAARLAGHRARRHGRGGAR